jgi:VIT1/CCC1 family predicted Fe2+/Mn2+ transporter
LTVPFALAAGLSGAVHSNTIVITAGIAEIVAGCIAMGLGGYLAGKTEQDHYESELKREYFEVDNYHQKEIDEVKEIFADYGIDEAGQTLLANQLAKDKDKWVDFMMRFELGLEKPHPKRARNSALTIGCAYIVGGFLPLSAYFFTDTPTDGLKLSALFTTCCLFIFGYFKSKVTGQPPISGAIKVTLVGLLAAGAAFGIAKFIS